MNSTEYQVQQLQLRVRELETRMLQLEDRVVFNPPAPVQQEPVAWVDVKDTHYGPYEFHGKELLPVGKHDLYTSPPAQRKPLTHEMENAFKDGWQSAKAAHGIKD